MIHSPSLNLLIQFFKSERQSIRSIILFSICSNILLLAIPFGIQTIIQQYSILVFQQATFFLLFLVFIFLILIGGLRALQMLMAERLQRRLFLNTTQKLKSKIENLKNNDNNNALHRVNYIFEGIMIQKNITPLIIDGSTMAIHTVVVLLLISFYHPIFAAYSLIFLGSLYYVLIILGRKALHYNMQESSAKYNVIEHFQKLALKTATTQDSDEVLKKYFVIRESSYKIYFRQSILILAIKIIASILLLSVGGFLVIRNKMTIGQLFASELIITNLLISLFKFTHLLDYWYNTLVSLNKINTYLYTPEEKVD